MVEDLENEKFEKLKRSHIHVNTSHQGALPEEWFQEQKKAEELWYDLDGRILIPEEQKKEEENNKENTTNEAGAQDWGFLQGGAAQKAVMVGTTFPTSKPKSPPKKV